MSTYDSELKFNFLLFVFHWPNSRRLIKIDGKLELTKRNHFKLILALNFIQMKRLQS